MVNQQANTDIWGDGDISNGATPRVLKETFKVLGAVEVE